MIAKSVKVMQRTPNSLDNDPSVIEIMDQIDQMFQLLEKSSEEDFGYVSNDGRSLRGFQNRCVQFDLRLANSHLVNTFLT